MGARIAVAGASGYVGGELLRLLAGHPDLEIGPLSAQASVGTPVTALHPHLTGRLDNTVFVPTQPELLSDADLVFMALPHGESAKLAATLPAQLKVVDLGADFRLTDPQAWTRYYPTPHAGHWPYGLPELPGGLPGTRGRGWGYWSPCPMMPSSLTGATAISARVLRACCSAPGTCPRSSPPSLLTAGGW